MRKTATTPVTDAVEPQIVPPVSEPSAPEPSPQTMPAFQPDTAAIDYVAKRESGPTVPQVAENAPTPQGDGE